MSDLNETHDAALRSWVASANAEGTDFPIQNLPFGVFRRRGTQEAFRIGVAIGDQILDMKAAVKAGVFLSAAAEATTGDSLNAFMALGQPAWSALRLDLSRALRVGAAAQEKLKACLLAQADAEYAVPARIGDYTDFYVGVHHATAIGKLFRPDNPLMPNYKWVPIGYHGRSSSVVVSGTPIRRPVGQTKGDADKPDFGPSQKLDYELELGFFVGPGNELGEAISIDNAEAHLFGAVLFNDWSARDIQPWEYQPLGPFLSKNFGSTLSPWVVTMEALAPFRAPFARPASDPQPLPYLESPSNRATGALDIHLEAWLQTTAMRVAHAKPVRLSTGNVREAAYWTPSQLVTHHSVGGCNLRPGDLFGSGTLSGPGPGQSGSLVEMTQGAQSRLCCPTARRAHFLPTAMR